MPEKLDPGWYWGKHKHWTNYRGAWLMILVFPKQPGQWRGQDCSVYTKNSRTPLPAHITDLEHLTPILEPKENA